MNIQAELDLNDIRLRGAISDTTIKLRIRIFPMNTDDTHYLLVDDIRVYPKDASMSTQTYHPKTYQVTSQTDDNNISVMTEFDDYYRPVYTKNVEGNLLNYQLYYYSREVNADFIASDPNSIRTITSQSSGMMSNFNNGTTQKWISNVGTWAVESNAYSQSDESNSNTNSYYSCSQSGRMYYRWKITFMSGSIMAGVHIMADDSILNNRGNSYLIWQNNSFIRLYKFVNNSTYSYTDFTGLSAQNGSTYLYEVLYDPATGRFDLWRNKTYLGNWTDGSKLTTGAYLSLRTNCSHAHFDDIIAQGNALISTTYSDGLGKSFQTQTMDSTNDIISKTVFNSIGKTDKSYFPQSINNPSHIYYNLTSGLYDSYTYYTDPLARPYQIIHPNSSGTITYAYGFGSITVKDINHNDANYSGIYKQVTDETGKITTTFYDKLGKNFASTTSPKVTKSSKIYDILGNVLFIKPPNYYNPPSGTCTDWDSEMRYNTLGQLVYKQTPDEGTTQYIYDKMGNLRFSQNSNQLAQTNHNFTVYYYDALGRNTITGEEKNSSSAWYNGTIPSIFDNTYGTEAGEWKIKNYYDTNYILGSENHCQGELTKTEINDDLSTAAPEDSSRYIYNKFGQLIEKRISIDMGTPISDKSIHHSFDLMGHEIETIYPSGQVVRRKFNRLGQLEKVYNP
jgi:hypothetical protein